MRSRSTLRQSPRNLRRQWNRSLRRSKPGKRHATTRRCIERSVNLSASRILGPMMTGLCQQWRRFTLAGRWSTRDHGLAARVYDRRSTRHSMFWLSGRVRVDSQPAGASARRSRLEAVLFVAREPLSLRKLAQLANLSDGTEARTLINALRIRYDDRHCAFQVAQIAGGYQLRTRREFAMWLRPQSIKEHEVRLSAPAMETLVVVAYRQPVLRAEVEAIRGVACGDILRQLLERDFLRIVGRSEELGRPLQYGTTKRFLESFGLCSLDELPWAVRLRRSTHTSRETADLAPDFTPSGVVLTDGGDDT
ncbi:MAG TPA: SMC-Scp complex subunit ScpB [Lacipirellulaceae bacterium]|nr:SMC-Scp complex subunit ScpB [Lacipirellulaceae bacterium]